MKDQPFMTEVACQQCSVCQKRKVSQWVFRLNEEHKVSHSAHFVTLTYDPTRVPITEDGKLTLQKRDLQLFIKKIRKAQSKLTNTKIKYYACGEYGSVTHRPHYHLILFNLHHTIGSSLTKYWSIRTQDNRDYISNGFVDIGPVKSGAFHYVAGYALKGLKAKINWKAGDTREKEFIFMSQGLGKSYFVTRHGELTKKAEYLKKNLHGYITIEDGKKVSLPRYYKEKIFNKEEMVQLRIKSRQYDIERSNDSASREERFLDYMQRERKANDLKRKKL